MPTASPSSGKRLGVAIALALLAWSDASLAGEPAEKLPETPSLTNVRRQGWIQFTLSSGRIVVTGARGVNFSHGQIKNDRGEQLSIRVTSAEPVMSYELRTTAYRFLVDVASAQRLRVRRLPKADRAEPVPVEFRQSPGAPVALAVGGKDNQRVYRAESVWHLFVVEPTAARQHLGPLLKVLLPEWDFSKTADEIESALVHTAQSASPPDQKLWAQWVRQLGDASFARREQADRMLRESGRVAATFLGRLDPARLDAEQRYRVRRILEAMSNTGHEEVPPQLAAWLSGDATIWLALLSRPAEPTRRAAIKRLEAIADIPLTFDPAADEPNRQRQIEVIRTKIGKKEP